MANVVIVGAGPIGSWGVTAAVADGVVAGVSGVVDPDRQTREEPMESTGAPGYAARMIARGLLWPSHDVSVRIEPVFDDDTIIGALRRGTELMPGFYRPTDLPLRLGVR